MSQINNGKIFVDVIIIIVLILTHVKLDIFAVFVLRSQAPILILNVVLVINVMNFVITLKKLSVNCWIKLLMYVTDVPKEEDVDI